MILIFDNDRSVSEIENYALQNAGYKVKMVESTKELFSEMEKKLPQLVILDTVLNGDSGMEVLKVIRDNLRTRYIPVMFVSKVETELEKVRILDAGADEFITKPFGILEFVSRVNAIIRRVQNAVMLDSSGLFFEEIVINEYSREVTVGNEICALTYKEYELLKYMIKNKGIVLSREKMVENVWGFDFQGESRTVDMHIKSLRHKLGESGNYIKTVRNVGYKLCS